MMLLDLPDEIICKILMLLDPVYVSWTIARTCQYLHVISNDDSLWKQFCKQQNEDLPVASGFKHYFVNYVHNIIWDSQRMAVHGLTLTSPRIVQKITNSRSNCAVQSVPWLRSRDYFELQVQIVFLYAPVLTK